MRDFSAKHGIAPSPTAHSNNKWMGNPHWSSTQPMPKPSGRRLHIGTVKTRPPKPRHCSCEARDFTEVGAMLTVANMT